MTFDEWWDTTKAAATPETFAGWERSCKQAWDAAQAAERERVRGGHDMGAMCEAFHCLIEAHAQSQNPFHQPVSADAQTALRILRGVLAALGPNAKGNRRPDLKQ